MHQTQSTNPYTKLIPIDKHLANRAAIDQDMEQLLQEAEALKHTSATFKNQQYVHKYRSQKLLPSKSYARASNGQDDMYEFTPFTWPTLLLACQAGDEFNIRAIIQNRAFDPNDADELARCIDAAAKRGDEQIARLLILSGADPQRFFPDAPRKHFNPLNTAAAAGQTHLVVALLDLGADADAHPPALHVACAQGSLESVKAIVRWMEKDARDDAWMKLTDELGQTCVHRAAKYGRVHVLEFLCVHRAADINSVDNKKQTPLMLAVLLGSLATVQWMMKNGAVLNSACDHRGDNALLMSFFACTRRPGRLLTSRFQNEQPPQSSRGRANDDSSFHGIEETRRDEANVEYLQIVQYLLSLVPIEEQLVRNAMGESMLIMACKYAMESLVKIVLTLDACQTGPLINLKTIRNENALHFACRSQSVRIIYLLRAHGGSMIDEELLSNDGLRPIDVAASTGNIDVLDAMLSPTPLEPSPVGTKMAKRWEQGGKGNQYKGLHRLTHDISKQRLGRALLAAGKFGRLNCIERLIGYYRCAVNVVDANKNTPLHLAVQHNQYHAAKQLKRYGVPMQARNNQNQTVADVAALKIREEIIYGGNEGSGAKKMLDLLQMPFASGVHRILVGKRISLPNMNLLEYPLHKTNSTQYTTIVTNAREQLNKTGCATFPRFFTPAALEQSVLNNSVAANQAFTTDSYHNAFQLSGVDSAYQEDHPRNLLMRTKVASIAYDELERQGPLYQLYNDERFVEFVKNVTNKKEMYRLGDPLGACTVNVFRPGGFHAWHFDEAEFTTTLCLQQSEQGGEFEFTQPLRKDQNIVECSSSVAAVINAHSCYNAACDETLPTVSTTTAEFQPGTLQIFAGRYSFHRVKPVPKTATKDRLVAVLCFASEPGVVNSPDVQKMFWGRVKSNCQSAKL